MDTVFPSAQSVVLVCVHMCINILVIEVISKLVAAAELNKAMHF